MDIAVRAFGAMEIARRTGSVRLGSRHRQVLLASLLVHPGSVVPVVTLVDRLWPGCSPDGVAKRLQVHVHRLRRALEGVGSVRHHAPGYVLLVPPERVDVHRFEQLVRHGRRALAGGDTPAAVDLLRGAVTLCRGPAFQGLEDIEDLAVESRRLDELRLAAQEDRIAAELTLGEHASLVGELDALVAEHPLRERFRAQLMTALYRAGRKADALRVYRTGRRILVDELGVEPNDECRALVRAILADDPPLGPAPATTGSQAPAVPGTPRSVPRQLPAEVAGFTGRMRHLRQLDRCLSRRTQGSREPGRHLLLAAVDGMAGVGKTAVVVHWAYRVAHRFPDGQLYVNLRGYADGPALRPIQVLAQFLRALGVPSDQIPTEVDEAAARYRSVLAGRRVLVVLDNAADADQVRPLLPGGGACAAVVTSRVQLTGLLVREGARRVAVDVLRPDEFAALLSSLLGAGRVASEPGPVAALADLCGHLPLALRVAAASLATHPARTVAGYVAELRDSDRLAMLAPGGDGQSAVPAAFDLSYRRLPTPARRMFRLLGLAPGVDLTARSAAALGGTTPEAARRLLVELAGVHLLEEPVAGRYAGHDLLRRYAAGRAGAEDAPADRAAGLDRLYGWCLDTAGAAVRLLYPDALLVPGARERSDRAVPARLPSRGRARAADRRPVCGGEVRGRPGYRALAPGRAGTGAGTCHPGAHARPGRRVPDGRRAGVDGARPGTPRRR